MRRAFRLASVLALSGFVGCVGADPAPTSSTPTADGGGNPITNGDGGAPGTNDSGAPCNPSAEPQCNADATELVRCSNEGTTVSTACLLGCDAAQRRCKQTVPSGAAGSVDASTATKKDALDIADTIWVETDTGFITRRQDGAPFGPPIRAAGAGVKDGIGYELEDQTSGPKLAVFTFEKLTIGKDTVVHVEGTAAAAFIARDAIAIEGKLSVRGDCAAMAPKPGPGGFPGVLDGPTTSVREQSMLPYLCGGGGGGGNGEQGRNGANAYYGGRTGAGGVSGAKRAATVLVDPIITGGSGGGNYGGPGGGAIQLVTNGVIEINGVVDAAGCGGRRASINGASPSSCSGAGGAGAGGTIFFEAASVRVGASGRVLANGGGGGGGTNHAQNGSSARGDDGSDTDATPAKGGTATVSGSGGSCGAGSDGSPFAGGNFTGQCDGVSNSSSVQGSGGGGGPGHIAARTKDGAVAIAAGGIVSPAALRDFTVTK